MRETSVLCYVINIHARVAVPMPMGAGFGAGAPVLTRTRTRVVPTPGTRMGTPVPVLLPICEIYKAKSDLVQADVHSRLQSMKCGEKDNIRTHLTTMMTLREELAGMGAHVIDRDFMAMVIGSLPTLLCGIIRTTTVAIRASGRIVMSDIVIAVVFEEADHIKINNGGNSTTNNTALATSSKSRKWRGKGKLKKLDVKCDNCSRVGHTKDDCWRKGGVSEPVPPMNSDTSRDK